MTKRHIIISAGGTGGHVFPALSLYKALVQEGYDCTFVTDKRGHSYLQDIPCKVLSFHWGSGLLSKLLFFKDIALNTFKMLKIHKSKNSQLVIGFGGYSAFSTVLAAQLLKIPTWIMEQNALAGRTNKVLAKFASKVFLSYENTQGLKGECIGNPVRFTQFENEKKPFDIKNLKILILGGSQGATALGIPLAQQLIDLNHENIQITHQVRPNDVNLIKALYEHVGITATVAPFFKDVEGLMKECDLVLARSGASTVFECLFLQKPALFIPYPYARDNHQYFNAKALFDKRACILLEEKDLSGKSLKEILKKITPKQYESIQNAIKEHFPYKNPTQLLAQQIKNLLPLKE
ncbi:MAG TPA: UDP-N-acetylglucosamine--N-acetylmuramyl-(pentapeptide) pyrophosphoryl-undecaprenol N-acetylglucosamine transferase [Alphaproteobacteria bacterium]|nr:UDP-N-acetylglucosamine--N-acetylmuramyl-(pentapeptide) pyrophosphoryl-undecaprenol N-acetylglucosamine transferase [Alphaproteobacteria bacterium]